MNYQIFRDNLKQFITENGIMGTMAGVSIGIVTKDLITSLVGDIIIPSIILLLLNLKIKNLTSILPGNGTSDLNITNFIKQFVSWILVVIITFVFIRNFVQGVLGVESISKEKIVKNK